MGNPSRESAVCGSYASVHNITLTSVAGKFSPPAVMDARLRRILVLDLGRRAFG